MTDTNAASSPSSDDLPSMAIPVFGVILLIVVFIGGYNVWCSLDINRYGPVNAPLSEAATAAYGPLFKRVQVVSIGIMGQDCLDAMVDGADCGPESGPDHAIVRSEAAPNYLLGLKDVDGTPAIEVRTSANPASLTKAEALRQIQTGIAAGLSAIATARRDKAEQLRNEATWPNANTK